MKACPLTFEHPSEAQQLHGFGPKLCDRLTDKLKIYCSENGLPMPKKARGSKRQTLEAPQTDDAPPPPKRARKVKPYVPALRSGPYAIILALSTLDEDAAQGLTKASLINLAQEHCDASFTVPTDTTKYFTAWNSMRTLLDKDFVHERGRPVRRYLLTEEGREVARRIQAAEGGPLPVGPAAPAASRKQPSQHRDRSGLQVEPIDAVDLVGSGSDWEESTRTQNAQSRTTEPPPDVLPSFEPIILPPGSFSVHLVLDSREVRSVQDREYISKELEKKGVQSTTRALPLGDALWVARPLGDNAELLANAHDEDGAPEDGIEIVLDHIVERKRLDDMISSIKDGRFHEQKFRLRRSAIRNVTYIVEDFSISAERGEKYGDSLLSAITGTQVVNGYFVKQTSKIDETIQYLAKMTTMLQELYKTKTLRVVPSRVLHPQTYTRLQTKLRAEDTGEHYLTFAAFSSLCSKSDTMTLRDVFLKMLMCIRGVTAEKALEVQKQWQTPIQLFEALENVDGKARGHMISDQIKSSVPRKRITPALSTKIAEVFS